MKRLTLLLLVFVSYISTFAVTIDYGTEKQIVLKSACLNRDETIFVATPADYYDEYGADQTYDVMYVFDCQAHEFLDMVNAMQMFSGGGNCIVVGITNPVIPELNWCRLDDFLPLPRHCKKEEFRDGHCGGAENLKAFITKELIPYIDENYRTTTHRTGVGHSLGASFVLDCMLTCDPFDDYIAVSPNFAYDKDRVAEDFINFDFSKFENNKYVFISHADEDKEGDGWKDWKPAREKVYRFLATAKLPSNIKFEVDSFPTMSHEGCFPYAITKGESGQIKFRNNPPISEQTYHLAIRITVPDSIKELYITGNQECLGNWDPHSVKMKKINSTTFEAKMQAHSPALFKFTSGSWDPEVVVEPSVVTKGNASDVAVKTERIERQGDGNIIVYPRRTSSCEFKFKGWATY